MAFTSQTHTGISLTERWTAFRTDLSAAHAKRKVYSTTLRELSNLSNRELADLGIHRSNIKRLALEAAGY